MIIFFIKNYFYNWILIKYKKRVFIIYLIIKKQAIYQNTPYWEMGDLWNALDLF